MINGFTMDCITRVLFSMEVGAVRDKENILTKKATDLLNMKRYFYGVLCPLLGRILNIGLMNKNSSKYLLKLSHDNIEQRNKKGGQMPNDILGVMLQGDSICSQFCGL